MVAVFCLQIVRDLLSNAEAKAACDGYIAERASKGLRSLGVAVSYDDGQSWTLAGLISLLDPPRSDSAETIKQAQAMGVQVRCSCCCPLIVWQDCNDQVCAGVAMRAVLDTLSRWFVV